MASSSPLVSVVTPVYNAEAYLAECIESVLAQTCSNWEYVIVNNCSTDRSLEIAQRYARQDARIRIHDNAAFLNQLQNLNHSLRLIAPDSKYCKVVHADDWLFPECIERMVALAEAHPPVGIVSAYRLEENRITLDGLPFPSTVVAGREICRRTLLADLYVFGSPSSLLIRSDLIRSREAFYDESAIQADKKVCFEILKDADFGFVHQVLTYTRRHNESMTSLIHRYDTRRVGRLMYLLQYGPLFLSRQEYQERLRQEMESYYLFLGRSVFDLREKDFWAYHQSQLASLGYPLSRLRLVKASLMNMMNVKETFGRLRHAMAARRRQTIAKAAQDWSTVLSSIHTVKNGAGKGG